MSELAEGARLEIV